MRWSWKIARIAGIDVFMHWTFLLLLAWIVGIHMVAGATALQAARGVALVLAVFGCIILHELGHALTARRYSIQTRDITLLPIGGLARLERMPEDPKQEIWVALAGPAVNVVIAAVLLAGIWLTGGIETIFPQPQGEGSAEGATVLTQGSFAATLMWINVVLVVFNMLPAFPMDGGRALRGVLGLHMSFVRSTEVAANIGQGMAVLFGLIGLLVFFNPILLFVALFVYLGAEAELQSARFRSSVEGVTVRDAMMTDYRSLAPDDSLSSAAEKLLAGAQQDFPVVDDGRLQGLLRRADLVKGISQDGAAMRVSDVMSSDPMTADENEPLEEVVMRMREEQSGSLPVLRQGQVVGLLTMENIGELVMLQGNGKYSAREVQQLSQPAATAKA